MLTIFQQLEGVAESILARLSKYSDLPEDHKFSWPNYVYTSLKFRRAHLDIVDARDTKKLYMLHLTVFPHTDDPAPIFGFDIIAGPNKVTGAFHDFSPIAEPHKMSGWFKEQVAPYEWSKKRELPDWAKAIFSDNMIAAGNISDSEELERLLKLVLANLDYYLENVGEMSCGVDFTEAQNWYCHNQKKNPHTPKVMAALGLDQDEVAIFIEQCLFPEVGSGVSTHLVS